MRMLANGERVAAATILSVLLGVLVLGGLFLGSQIVTGALNMADVLHRLPKPVAAAFVDDPDVAMAFDCDNLDETDPDALERYAAGRGLSVVFVPAGRPQPVVEVHWIYWRDRLVAYGADADIPATDNGGTACAG